MSRISLWPMLLVAAGGGIGSVGRYLAGLFITQRFGGGFPYSTLSINLVGCLLIGLADGVLSPRGTPRDDLRVLLMIGVLGGFTTFSAFGFETLALLRDRQPTAAAAYVAASVLLGVACVWAGQRIADVFI